MLNPKTNVCKLRNGVLLSLFACFQDGRQNHTESYIVVDSLFNVLYFQRCIVMRQFYFSYKQVKHDYSMPRAYAGICGRLNLTVNRDYLPAQNQGKLATVCLQRFSSIFGSTIPRNICKGSVLVFVLLCIYLCSFYFC